MVPSVAPPTSSRHHPGPPAPRGHRPGPALPVPRLHPARHRLPAAPHHPPLPGRPGQPGQPAQPVHLPPPHRDPPMGLGHHPEPRRHRHRHQPLRPHPARPQPPRHRRLTTGGPAGSGAGARRSSLEQRGAWVARPFIIKPGTNRLDITVSTFSVICSQSTRQAIKRHQACLHLGDQHGPSLPAGRYEAVLEGAGLALAPPVPVLVTIEAPPAS